MGANDRMMLSKAVYVPASSPITPMTNNIISFPKSIDLAALARFGNATQISINAGKHIPNADRQSAPNSDMKRPRRGTATAKITVKEKCF